MVTTGSYDLAAYFGEHLGDGSCRLRTETTAQPLALRAGDRLITGERVLAPPEDGGSVGVLVYLAGGVAGHGIRIPARIPVALANDTTPTRSDPRCESAGHTPFWNYGFCARCGSEVEVKYPPKPDWSPDEGPWCLKQWLPFNVVDQKIDTCLLELNHEGDCRGIHGRLYDSPSVGRCIGQLKNKESDD